MREFSVIRPFLKGVCVIYYFYIFSIYIYIKIMNDKILNTQIIIYLMIRTSGQRESIFSILIASSYIDFWVYISINTNRRKANYHIKECSLFQRYLKSVHKIQKQQQSKVYKIFSRLGLRDGCGFTDGACVLLPEPLLYAIQVIQVPALQLPRLVISFVFLLQ